MGCHHGFPSSLQAIATSSRGLPWKLSWAPTGAHAKTTERVASRSNYHENISESSAIARELAKETHRNRQGNTWELRGNVQRSSPIAIGCHALSWAFVAIGSDRQGFPCVPMAIATVCLGFAWEPMAIHMGSHGNSWEFTGNHVNS